MEKKNLPNDANHSEEIVEKLTPAQFGEIFKAARVKAGFSIEQISSSTRILENFIRALEEGNFSALPGPVFGRGFIRSIYKNIRVDSVDILKAYDEACGLAEKTVPTQHSSAATSRDTLAKKAETVKRTDSLQNLNPSEKTFADFIEQLKPYISLSWLKHVTPLGALWIGGFLLIFVSVGYLTVQLFSDDQAPRQSASVATNNETEDSNVNTTDEEQNSEAAAEEEETTASNPQSNEPMSNLHSGLNTDALNSGATKAPAPDVANNSAPSGQMRVEVAAPLNAGNGQQVLDFSVKAKVKVRMKIDEGNWETLDLNEGEWQYRFSKSAHLLVFDAGAVQIAYNGKPLGELGKQGRVRRLSFAANAEAYQDQENF